MSKLNTYVLLHHVHRYTMCKGIDKERCFFVYIVKYIYFIEMIIIIINYISFFLKYKLVASLNIQ